MIYVFVWLLCGVIAAAIYSRKGRPGAAAFIVGVLLGPLGVLLALLSSTDTAAVERAALASGASKKCPHCGEIVRAEASVCRYCQRDLPAQVAQTARPRAVTNGQGGFVCSQCGGGVRHDATSCKHCNVTFSL